MFFLNATKMKLCRRSYDYLPMPHCTLKTQTHSLRSQYNLTILTIPNLYVTNVLLFNNSCIYTEPKKSIHFLFSSDRLKPLMMTF